MDWLFLLRTDFDFSKLDFSFRVFILALYVGALKISFVFTKYVLSAHCGLDTIPENETLVIMKINVASIGGFGLILKADSYCNLG